MRPLIVAGMIAVMGIPIVGVEASFLLNSVDMSRVTRKGAVSNDEKSLEQIQSYLLETLFLRPLSEGNKAIREEEEASESDGMSGFSDAENQQALMDRVFASHLAQQDLLRFKKLYLKKPVSHVTAAADVPQSVQSAPYTLGRLSD